MVVNMVVGVSMRVIVGLLVFVESLVGMEVVVLVDMTEFGARGWGTRLEEIFFYLLFNVLTDLCSEFWLMKFFLRGGFS